MLLGMTEEMNNLSRSGCNKVLSALAIFSAFILFSGCDDVHYMPPDPIETLNFGIVIFDEAGTEGTSFRKGTDIKLSLIHISEPTRLLSISYAVFCLKK